MTRGVTAMVDDALSHMEASAAGIKRVKTSAHRL